MKKKKAQVTAEQDAVNQQVENAVETATEQEQEKEEKKSRKVLNTVINAILIVAIVVAVIATYISFVSASGHGVPNIFGLRLLSIQTNSMYDTIHEGDLAIATGVEDPSTLRKGDIITYWTTINGESVLNTHRIVEIYNGGEFLYFKTKGDANTIDDPLTVHESEIVGQYKARIPGVGKFFDYLQTGTGFFIVVVVPVFLFFLFHLVQFFRVLFEYQNVKNRIKYEQERGRTEDLIAAAQTAAAQTAAAQSAAAAQAPVVDRAAIEAEIREKLKAELLASMLAQQNAQPAAPQPVAEQPATEQPAVEQPAVEQQVAETPATENTVAEEAPAAETAAENTSESE